jgi:HEAT repeat protein
MDLYNYLQNIGSADHPLAMRDLRPLSDLDPSKRSVFFEVWPTIIPLRRSEIVHALVDLAEDNVDLHFQTVLLWCLEDEDADVRTTTIEGLWESELPSVLRRLLTLLRSDPVPAVRAAAAIGLSRFAYLAEMGELDGEYSEALRDGLLATIQDKRQPQDVRRRALESAGYYASEDDVLEEIQQAYSAEELELRESALVAMGRTMLPRWLPLIARELESRSPAMRYEAASAAGEMGEEARPLVVRVGRLLGDNDTEVALAAIRALGQIGGEAAQRILRDATKSENEARAQAAAEALAELSPDAGMLGDLPGMPGRRGGRSGIQN